MFALSQIAAQVSGKSSPPLNREVKSPSSQAADPPRNPTLDESGHGSKRVFSVPFNSAATAPVLAPPVPNDHQQESGQVSQFSNFGGLTPSAGLMAQFPSSAFGPASLQLAATSPQSMNWPFQAAAMAAALNQTSGTAGAPAWARNSAPQWIFGSPASTSGSQSFADPYGLTAPPIGQPSHELDLSLMAAAAAQEETARTVDMETYPARSPSGSLSQSAKATCRPACLNCRKSKVRCVGNTPCDRCIRLKYSGCIRVPGRKRGPQSASQATATSPSGSDEGSTFSHGGQFPVTGAGSLASFSTDTDGAESQSRKPQRLAAANNKHLSASTLKAKARGRIYKCPVPGCGQTFDRVFSLKRHNKRHTGERPHGCDICGRRFGERSTLKRHMKKHEKEQSKKYLCKHAGCCRGFESLSELNRHTLSHKSPAKACHVRGCGRTFNTQRMLQKHLDVVHNSGATEAALLLSLLRGE